MRLQHILLGFLFALLATKVQAQADLTLYNMNWIPQSMYQNPALTPPTRVNIGLPGISSIYGQAGNTGFAWKNLFMLEGDSLVATPDVMLEKLGKKNFMMGNANLDLLSFGFKSGERGYISFNLTERFYSRFTYTDDLMRLGLKGNVPFLGQSAEISGSGVDAGYYHEVGIGYTRDLDEEGKIKVGGRLKYLNGVANVQTKSNQISLFTDADFFYLTGDVDATLNTSGINRFADSDSLNDPAPGEMILGKNHGAGIDLGFQWEIVPEKVRLSGSLIDLGFIRWKNDPLNYSTSNATFTFEGLDVADFPSGDSVNAEYFDSLLTAIGDSMVGIFNPDTSYNAYTTMTIPRFYIGGNYLINESMDAGLLFAGEVYKGTFRPSLTASYNLRVGRVLQLSASWSYVNRSFLNPGFGFSVNGGPVQLYAATDNLLSFFSPQSTRQAHLHAGINLTFGRAPKDRDEDGILDKDDQCPDVPGLAEFAGCPDTDGDKIIDMRDSCVTVPGEAKFNGCPDRDHDDIEDKLDNCPDEPGLAEFMGCPDRDGDKIMDREDACPDQPGPLETKGCPDRDRDGVLDMDDLCPDKPGPADHKGCPDTDGDGIYDDTDKCVMEFGPQDNFGCPYGDLDKDGVYDKEDRCVDTPGPKENQGCPYGDLDADGVTDNIDQCPNTPGPADNNGCPKLTEKEQEVLDLAFKNLEFETGKAIIRATSYPSLDSLAALLIKKPDWKLSIAGHTDNVGADAANMTLSKNRSNAVKDYLNSRGVAAERFVVEWFGETKPIADNKTPAGRQTNRRVEMKVLFE
jgi:outer membrane protein OmpA-like peptidoglycan-associated protein